MNPKKRLSCYLYQRTTYYPFITPSVIFCNIAYENNGRKNNVCNHYQYPFVVKYYTNLFQFSENEGNKSEYFVILFKYCSL